MELRHLRYFVAVAEELHFHRAAERLHISQPPLSQQIRALEAELGVALFERNRRRVELTPAGTSFLADARAILEATQHATDRARRVAAGELGSLSVGFVGSATFSPVLPAILRDFRSRFPDVGLSLRELQTAEQLAALTAGRLDVGVIRGPLAASELDPGLELVVIQREQLVVALPETHPLAGGLRVRAADLRGETLVILRRHEAPGLFASLNTVLAIVGGVPEDVLEVAEMQTILALVASGIGISLVPASVGDSERIGVAFRPLADPSPTTELALAWRGATSSPARDAFLAVAVSDHTEE
ncbi:MAG TPA: LysR substrate-binding domain-containing protein [Solirubrobacteraceae bacterium]|nr:LysR substrate-binding domain-containing protein [Solirubrobacteraceae bacterium]